MVISISRVPIVPLLRGRIFERIPFYGPWPSSSSSLLAPSAQLPLMNGVYLSLHPPPRRTLFCVSRNFLGSRAPPRSHPHPRLAVAVAGPPGSPGAFFLAGAVEKRDRIPAAPACARSEPLRSVSCSLSSFLWIVVLCSVAQGCTRSACE